MPSLGILLLYAYCLGYRHCRKSGTAMHSALRETSLARRSSSYGQRPLATLGSGCISGDLRLPNVHVTKQPRCPLSCMHRFKSVSGACAGCPPRAVSQSCQVNVQAIDGSLKTRTHSIRVRPSQLLPQRNMFKSVRNEKKCDCRSKQPGLRI